MLAVGDQAPDFSADTDGGGRLQLSQLRGQRVVLYFYPKDGTPGCLFEACAFRDAHEEISAKGCVVVGVSPDSVRSHNRFSARHSLPFRLVSDPDHTIAESYGVWRPKILFGNKYLGIVRSTFVISADGKIEAVYDRVKIRGHVAEVLAKL